LTAGIIFLSLSAAVLGGIGLSFLLPIIETAQSSALPLDEGIVGVFVAIYSALDIPSAVKYILLKRTGDGGALPGKVLVTFILYSDLLLSINKIASLFERASARSTQ